MKRVCLSPRLDWIRGVIRICFSRRLDWIRNMSRGSFAHPPVWDQSWNWFPLVGGILTWNQFRWALVVRKLKLGLNVVKEPGLLTRTSRWSAWGRTRACHNHRSCTLGEAGSICFRGIIYCLKNLRPEVQKNFTPPSMKPLTQSYSCWVSKDTRSMQRFLEEVRYQDAIWTGL